jgi:hypothetical protein
MKTLPHDQDRQGKMLLIEQMNINRKYLDVGDRVLERSPLHVERDVYSQKIQRLAGNIDFAEIGFQCHPRDFG